MQDSVDKHLKINIDYTLDILQELIQSAKNMPLPADYFSTVQQNNISPAHRGKLVEWMIEISDEIKLNSVTKHTAIIIVDLIMSQVQITKPYLQLLAITAMMISIKQEESFRFKLTDAVAFCANTYTSPQVAKMEILVLRTLGWKTVYPTPGEIARRLLLFTHVLKGHDMPQTFKQIDNYIDLCLYDFELNIYGPLIIGVASIFCVLEQFKLLQEAVLFKKQIETLFHLDSSKIIECFKTIFSKINNVEPQNLIDQSMNTTANTSTMNMTEISSPYTPVSLTANDSMEIPCSQSSVCSSQTNFDINVLQSPNNSFLVTPEKLNSGKKSQTSSEMGMEEEVN